MQTSLLGVGIAIILALLAALLAPPLFDWGHYRSAIEGRASELAGVPVHVSGPIVVRLLPTPTLKLSGVEIGEAGTSQSLKARSVAMEFSLGTLMRGELRAHDIAVDGPEMVVALNQSGQVDIPAFNPAFNSDQFGVEHFTVSDGALTFTDADSGGRLVVDNWGLNGSINSLSGPLKAEGSFAANGERFNYRISTNRRSADGSMKLRLAIDASERALALETDGALRIESGSPRYEGAVTVSRVIGTALPDRPVTINVPWRLAGKLKATAREARFEQVDLQYGPESRAVRLTGTADLAFGLEPRMAATLSALHVDLDRLLPTDTPRRRPVEAVKTLMDDLLAAAPAAPLPIHVTVGIDSLALGGGVLTGVHGDVNASAAAWDFGTVEFRAPGATQVRMSGRLTLAENLEFTGPVAVDSGAPATFFAWIEGNNAAGASVLGPMRGNGTITLGGTRVAIESLKADIDRKVLEGHVEYRFATSAATARLDAVLAGPEVDIDRAFAIGTAVFATAVFERPGEIALGLDIGRAYYEGVEARGINAKLTFDRSGLNIERLTAADLGGATFDARGRIDNAADVWRGSIAISAAAPRLDGMIVLADRFLPDASEMLRRYGSLVAPLNLTAKLDVEPRHDTKGGPETTATLKIDGKASGVNVHVDGSGAGDVTNLADAELHVGARLDADDGRSLAALFGLDRLGAASTRPARFTLLADGSAARSFTVDVRFAGSDIDATATGAVKSSGSAALDVSLRAADAKLPRRAGSPPLPVDLHMRVVREGDAIDITEMAGKAAGSPVEGRLSLHFGTPLRVDGRIKADQADAGEVIAVLAGAPRGPARRTVVEWVAEPFAPANGINLEGRIEFRVATAQWIAGLTTRDLSGTLSLGPTGFSLTDVTGILSSGHLLLNAGIQRERGGLEFQSRMTLTNADLPVLLAGALRVPAAGRVSVSANVQGQGLSPAALVGALEGSGVVTMEQVDLAGLDTTALNVVLGALANDRALAGNTARVSQIANTALDAKKAHIEFAAIPLVIGQGQVRMVNFTAPAKGADLSGSISLGLHNWELNADLTMTGPIRQNAPSRTPPAMAVAVKGPLWAARRNTDVAGLIGWELMRSADQDTKILDTADAETQHLEPEMGTEVEAGTSRRTADSTVEIRLPLPRPARRPASRSPKTIESVLTEGR